MIEEAAGKEELLGGGGTALAGAKTTTSKEPKAPKPFEFKADAKLIAVPSFKWKATEGTEKLQVYADAIRKLLKQIDDQIEERLTNPSL
jgi:hypothetical protein